MARTRPGGMRPTTNRGRSPSTWSRRSSARKIGVVEVETFSKDSVTAASWPTLMRSGRVCRSMRIRVLRVRTRVAEMIGRPMSSTLTRVRSGKPRMMPASSSRMPERKKARPRVVRTARRARTTVTASAGGRRHGHLAKQVGDDLGGRAAGELGLARGYEPVGQHRRGEHLHVVGDDVVAPLEGGVGPCGAQQVQRGAWRRTEAQGRGRARSGDEVDDVLAHGWAG